MQYVAIKMHHTRLPLGIRVKFSKCLQQAKAFIRHNEVYLLKSASSEIPKKLPPALRVLARPFCHAENFTEAAGTHAYGYKHGYVLNFTAPRAFKPYPIHKNVRGFRLKWSITPFFNPLKNLLIQVAYCAWTDPAAPKSLGNASTRRTDTPARYISTKASSTELSRRRYRSIIAVSNGMCRNLGTLR